MKRHHDFSLVSEVGMSFLLEDRNLTRDEEFIAECLRLAEKGRGYVSPNPLVGAVLVKNNRIVARGWHRQFGGHHAEVECLRSYKGDARGATLFVNLEPCAHQGKTPPCTDLILDSGIRKVVVSMKDPNPLVNGSGIRTLRRAGVDVHVGVLRREGEELNRPFMTLMRKRRPYVHMKVAQTLDGKIALKKGSPVGITGLETRKLVHRWRAEHDAVLVGVGTIHSDNPQLTVRSVKGRDPAVVILDGSFSIKTSARVLLSARKRQVIVCVSSREGKRRRGKVKELTSLGSIVLLLPAKVNTFNTKSILQALYRMNIFSVLVEGGSEVFSQFLREGPLDQLSVFVAPSVFQQGVAAFAGLSGGPPRPIRGQRTVQLVGKDTLMQFSF